MTPERRPLGVIERSGTVLSRERRHRRDPSAAPLLNLTPIIDEPVWDHVQRAVVEAADGLTDLNPRGSAALREAIAAKVLISNGLVVEADRSVLVTNGAKQALQVCLAGLLSPGDGVLFATPGYVYGGTIELAGGTPQPVAMSALDGFAWDVERFESCVTPTSKVLIVNVPCNPTGHLPDDSGMRTIAEFARRHQLWLVIDAAHELLIDEDSASAGGHLLSAAGPDPIVVFSMTKAHNLARFRVGYMVGPPLVVDRAASVLEWNVLALNSISQAAALSTFNGPPEPLVSAIERARHNARVISAGLARLHGLGHLAWRAGAHHWVDISKSRMSSRLFSDFLLSEYGILTDPGEIFGQEGWIRLGAIGSAPDVVGELLGRLGSAVARHELFE